MSLFASTGFAANNNGPGTTPGRRHQFARAAYADYRWR